MAKNKLVYWVLLAGFTTVYAQTDFKNNQKYWFYRYRLLHEFVAKGEASCGTPSGFSIPASSKYKGSKKEVIEFGDGTSFLGNYIGVLATEHLRMERKNEPYWKLEKVRQELYYAMKAYERLDQNAEVIYWEKTMPNCNSNKNGFFTREDVDSSFVRKNFSNLYFTHANVDRDKVSGDVQDDLVSHDPGTLVTGVSLNGIPYSYIKTKQTTEAKAKTYGNCGDYKDCAAQTFPSQDQISNLFVGFALVKRCMGANSYNGYNFSEKAVEYTRDINNYLYLNNYKINYPGTTEHVKYGGEEVQLNARGIHDAARYITGDNKDELLSTALLASSSVWETYNFPQGDVVFRRNYLGDGHDYNNAVLAQFAAIANNWKVGFIPYKLFSGNIPISWIPCVGHITTCNTCCFPDLIGDGCTFCNMPCDISFNIENCFVPNNTLNAELWCYRNTISDYVAGFSSVGLSSTVLSGLAFMGFSIGNQNTGLCAPFKLPDISMNTTPIALSYYGTFYNIENFALLNRFLYPLNSNYTYSSSKINEYFNTAPCNGPHYAPINDPNVNPFDAINKIDQVGDKGVPGWRVDNRFEKSNESIYSAEMGSISNNGLDYMLAYNLFILNHPEYESYQDVLDLSLTNVAYPSGNGELSDSKKGGFNGFETIECSNFTLNSGTPNTQYNGNCTLRAGKSIKLSGNVAIKSGSVLKAYIDPKFGLNCAYAGGVNYTIANLREESPVATVEPVVTQIDTASIIKGLKELDEKFKKTKDDIDKKYAQSKYVSKEEYVTQHTTGTVPVFFKIYPNPSNDLFTISSKYFANQNVRLEVKNTLSATVKEVKTGAPCDEVKLDLKDFPDGVYFLSISGRSGIYKLVKSNK